MKNIQTNFGSFVNRINENNSTEDDLKKFFEDEDFNIHLGDEDDRDYVEIETWTKGGVNMIFILEPFTKKSFIDYVEDFDIDEQIDLHRRANDYKNAFTIRESLEDFTEFHNRLKELVKKLNNEED